MKIGWRILLGYFLIVGLAGWFVLNVFVAEVKPGVRATLEDTLADTAALLARLVTPDLKAGTLGSAAFSQRMNAATGQPPDVSINGVSKPSSALRVTITDAQGVVVFDSTGRDLGKNHAQWNDVYLTLRGKYGARSTLDNPADPASTVMHVAAPIRDGDRLIGVVSVAKAIATVQPFVQRSQNKILRRSAVLLGVSLLIGIGFAWWLARAIGKLQRYATAVEAGRKVTLPALGNHEIGALGRALESMRNKLEGKQYVEDLMHTLAHELKSPIAAIQAAAELLGEEMTASERQSFLATILEQNHRQRQLIERLLALVKVEKQQTLAVSDAVQLDKMIDLAWADCAATADKKNLSLDRIRHDAAVSGDPLLLRQAVGNILDNAIDFATPDSAISIAVSTSDHAAVTLSIHNAGEPIPAYAIDRLFERFYSLPRLDGIKSTGLGLPFVREVMALHGGAVRLANAPEGGVIAQLSLPLITSTSSH